MSPLYSGIILWNVAMLKSAIPLGLWGVVICMLSDGEGGGGGV